MGGEVKKKKKYKGGVLKKKKVNLHHPKQKANCQLKQQPDGHGIYKQRQTTKPK